jgi:DNA-binding response OmpR family regulator
MVASGHTILCIEGRKPLDDRLSHVLNDEGYRVVSAGARRTALAKVGQARPSMIVVDAPSLRCDGRRLCDSLREESYGIPLLALLPTDRAYDCPQSADSCLRYPVDSAKLAKRVARLLAPVLQVGDVIFDTNRRKVGYCESRKPLTPKQGHLLEVLMRHPDQVLTRAFLMKQVWDTDYLGDTRTLYVHVRWLRKAIEKDASSPVFLRTVRGIGYRFGSASDS